MERGEGDYIPVEESYPLAQIDGEVSALSSTLVLDHVGEVVFTFNSDGLSWKFVESSVNDDTTFFGIELVSKVTTEIKFSDVYAAEFINYGIIHGSSLPNAGRRHLGHESEMYHFTVHGFERSKTLPSLWVLAVYTFGHKDQQTCQMWVDRINASLNLEVGRPKNLMGGDGFFNEILNGLLKSRHKAPYPPAPSDFIQSEGYNDSFSENLADQDQEFPIPNEMFRFGIIPAGSTDTIVMCTTGARDPITSALHIVLGKRVCLDLAQVVRWKTMSASTVEPCVRYAASFAGYGFYGDVITESEKHRWMGPIRYDYAGTEVFLRHRSYQAEIAYLEVNGEERNSTSESCSSSTSVRVICQVNCNVCSTKPIHGQKGSCRLTPYSRPGETRWQKSKGRYLSVGAAVISNRSERAPDGLVADAHLSDGFLHLILIKECPHAFYLWHLTQLAIKGGNPLNYEFVEHHKTTAFTFTSSGNESVWNLDGEIFQAHKLSAQVFRGLVSLFAAGPEV